MKKIHERIEMLAGAIALGEASDAERLEYREHISSCQQCLNELGGEHEIERVAQTVAAARDTETWSPEIGDIVARRTRSSNRKLRYGVSVAGLAIAASLAIHAIAVGTLSPFTLRTAKPVAFDFGATRIVLEQRHPDAQLQGAVAPARSKSAASTPRRLVVLHNVISMQRQTVNGAHPQPGFASGTSVVVHAKRGPADKPKGDRPVWEEQNSPSWRTVATTTTVSQMETAPQSFTHNAESIQFNAPPAHDREAALAGGETAINPQPPMIAYDEGAEGTSVFEVSVDPRGTPLKCTITRSSDYPVLDNAVCKAAMAARYLPKIQDGRAVSGVYRDAFTFRMQDDPFHPSQTSSIESQLPHRGAHPRTSPYP